MKNGFKGCAKVWRAAYLWTGADIIPYSRTKSQEQISKFLHKTGTPETRNFVQIVKKVGMVNPIVKEYNKGTKSERRRYPW